MIEYKTTPFEHQRKDVEEHWADPHWGRFWEPGCGKTMPTLVEAHALHQGGEITGLVCIAPNGVHRNWAVDQVPTHYPGENIRIHTWQSKKAKVGWHRNSFQRCHDHDGMAMLFMSYDAVRTKPGQAAWKSFLKSRRCLYVLDEMPRIKTPGSKLTLRIQGSRNAAPFRRGLTGTPVDDKPFDVYSQIKFLNPEAWKEIGCGDFASFKATFGIWQEFERKDTGQRFKKLVEYRNMDLLRQVMAANGSRITKDDALDLPDKLYSTRYFEMSAAQRRAYKELKENMMTFLDDGEMVSSELMITRMLRFQQITSGWIATDDDELVPIGTDNPRLQLLREIVEDTEHQMIIWAKYRQDITNILEMLGSMGVSAVRYDGECSDEEMAHAIDTFKAGGAQVFVANPKKGGEGITLTCAKTMVYYNCEYHLARRIQSEDRIHRIGQDTNVHIIDLAAQDSIDLAIIDALRSKHKMAAYIQGDEYKDWI